MLEHALSEIKKKGVMNVNVNLVKNVAKFSPILKG